MEVAILVLVLFSTIFNVVAMYGSGKSKSEALAAQAQCLEADMRCTAAVKNCDDVLEKIEKDYGDETKQY